MIEILTQMTLSELLLLISSVIMLIGSIGLFIFRDVYTRTHAATLITVGGVCFSLLVIGFSIFMADFLSIHLIKMDLIIILILVTSPIAAQAIVESAHKQGIKPILGISRKAGVKKK